MTPAWETSSSTGLIVALDQSDLEEAVLLARRLSLQGVAFKVGLTLFAAAGPAALRRIAEHGRVFCDLKLHDIPHQVAMAAARIRTMGAWMISIHASGGSSMISGAAESVRAASVEGPPTGHSYRNGRTGRGGARRDDEPVLAAVTVLTSISPSELAGLGQGNRTDEQVLRLARLAAGAGANGIVCSPHEVFSLRQAMGPDMVLVTPGVRPSGSPAGDQKRIMTPGEAASFGADYVVVGRPITDARDPETATAAILQELSDARA